MIRWIGRTAAAVAVVVLLGFARKADAIPAFARKYGTSCQTCHVVYPKLTPFGEAFRRNGYRFPGVDSDYVKQETVPLGQDAQKKAFPNTVWPGWIPAIPGIAIGANGQAVIHPQKSAGAAQADNGTVFSLDGLVAEAHLWAGAALDDTITVWAELTVARETGGATSADVEHAEILFNDLFGPKHLFNLVVGRGFPTYTSFAPHSSYLADTFLVSVPVTAVYGNAGPAWQLVDNYNLVELNGIAAGRFEYGVGINAGANVDIRPTENVYGHLALKLGGMRLDGEGSTGAEDTAHPWAETALTLFAFASHSNSRYVATLTDNTATPPASATSPFQDVATTVGGGVRGQLGSLELNLIGYWDDHGHAAPSDTGGPPGEVSATVLSGELSYVLFPWLVPALRVEHVVLSPTGGTSVNDTRIIPGVAMLIRPNVKVTVVGVLERASGLPAGGAWGPAGGSAAPADPNTSVSLEIESINVGLAFAF